MTKTAIFPFFVLMTAALPLAAQAPVFDTSGNGMLKGSYYFRYVLYGVSYQPDQAGITGDINEAISLYGNISFDGNGNYSITNGFVADSANGVSNDPLSCYIASSVCASNQSQPVSGTYSISASGYGFLSNQITGDAIYGLVAANGIFSGSSTEATQGYNDMFLASPIPSPALTNFSGSYNVVGYLPGEDFAFQMNPNGSGSIGAVNLSGYIEGVNGTQTQSSNLTYRFSNGAGVLVFPNSNNAAFLNGGNEFIYFSPDGQFFFGGNQSGFDMIMGVTNKGSNTAFGACNGGTSCLFYGAGIDQNVSAIGKGFADLDSYFGSFNATKAGAIIGHQRLSDLVFYGSTYGFIFSDSFTYPVPGAYTDNVQSFNFWVGDGGTVRIGQGLSPFLGITVGFQAPAFTPTSSVYINPQGVVNAASFAPFTAGLSNGEFITIFGSNLSSKTVVASTVPYPAQLNNVQVMINGVPAPLYLVSAGQISALVPSGNPFALAAIQVNNNGNMSNVVTMPLGAPGSTPATITSPGAYNYPPGSGFAAAVDANTGTIVTTSNPARPGDTIEVFLSGLGAVFPTVPDGAAAPGAPPLSQTVNTVSADVDGETATVSFAGLAPTLAGLYQVNVTIPTDVKAGNHFLDFSVSDPNSTNQFNLEAYTQQVLIPVGGGAAAQTSEVAPRTRAMAPKHPHATRKPFCAFNCSTPRP